MEIKGSKNFVEGGWKWGEHKLPKLSNCSYLGIDFASNGAWDVYTFKEVNQLHSVITQYGSTVYIGMAMGGSAL